LGLQILEPPLPLLEQDLLDYPHFLAQRFFEEKILFGDFLLWVNLQVYQEKKSEILEEKEINQA